MSENKVNTMLNKKSTWWNEPMVWLIIALPVAAVIGASTSAWIAIKNADTPVIEEHAKQGMGIISLAAERDRKAAELGAEATLSAQPGRLTLTLSGHFATPPKHLLLTLAHPSNADLDMVVLLEPAGDNEYAAAYASIPDGKRLLDLSPSDKAWRLTGQWQAPFTGSTQLSVSSQFSSTQHSSTQP